MSIQHIILGFLQEGAKNGYTLKKEIVAVPFFHSSANNNQIYTTLLHLHRTGLVDVTLHTKERGAASKVYSITPAGENELTSWVAATPESAEYYSYFHQQLAFAHRLNEQELTSLFEAYETKTKARMVIAKELYVRFATAQRSNPGNPAEERGTILWEAIFEHRMKIYELELAWLQQLRHKLLSIDAGTEGSKQG